MAERCASGLSHPTRSLAGYNRLLNHSSKQVQLAYCWAHAHRKLYEVAKNSTALIAQEGLNALQNSSRLRLTAIVNGHKQSNINKRLPWNYTKTKPEIP